MMRIHLTWPLPAILVLPALLLLPGCLHEKVVEPTPVPFARLTPAYRAGSSGLLDPERVVVRDAATLARWWTKAWPELAVPEVDFGSRVVLVVAMGERSSGGYTIRVSEVVAEGADLRATVLSTTPGRGCAVATVMTQPVDFVSVPAHGKSVRFVEESRAANCD
jgi:hypothetical protein